MKLPVSALLFVLKVGISAEKQKELFAPLSGDGRRNGQGHGLGLSIVRRIVTRLGGTVSVESEIGKGSRFSFVLPKAF